MTSTLSCGELREDGNLRIYKAARWGGLAAATVAVG